MVADVVITLGINILTKTEKYSSGALLHPAITKNYKENKNGM